MPIHSINDTHVTQRCASCAAQRDLPLEGLTPAEDDSTLDGGVLGLPPCACGSVEYLIRAPVGEPPHPALGSLGHLHRLVVDALVDEVKERRKGGRKAKPFAAAMKTRLGSDALSQWFPRGLKVELQPQAEPDADNTEEHP
jgi:hypothetical protein